MSEDFWTVTVEFQNGSIRAMRCDTLWQMQDTILKIVIAETNATGTYVEVKRITAE